MATNSRPVTSGKLVDLSNFSFFVEVSPIHDGVNYTVTKGLSAGDRIVTTGVGLLNDGDEITITDNAGGEV